VTDARVTQAPVEALVTPDDLRARVTQAPVEALVTPDDLRARVTQAPIEQLVLPIPTAARVTQAPIERLTAPIFARVTQAPVEQLVRREPVPPPPPPEPGSHPPHLQSFVWRDAKGQEGTTRVWIDPDNDENAGDLDAAAAHCAALRSRLSAISGTNLQRARGPYTFSSFSYPPPTSGADITDILLFAGLSTRFELVELRLPGAYWDDADRSRIADFGQKVGTLDAVLYWLAHFCSATGAPFLLFLAGRRYQDPVRRRFSRRGRAPDTTTPAL